MSATSDIIIGVNHHNNNNNNTSKSGGSIRSVPQIEDQMTEVSHHTINENTNDNPVVTGTIMPVKIIDESPLEQIKYPHQGPVGKTIYETLPSNVAIPVGLAQVFIGGAMVICGSLALRYRSYLFYYGTGLWAGTISGITGALVVMATKRGLPKPKWLCGGKKWQIHVVIGSAMLALTASILMSMFSTSGLMQDTQHPVGVEMGTPTKDEETFERRKSTGVAINAFLLLLAMLEILLCFCSLGMALRVLCRSKGTSSLFSNESAGSQVTIHEILGNPNATGPEYEARTDRLLRWLGYQRKNLFTTSPMKSQKPTKSIMRQTSPSIISISPIRSKRDHGGYIPQLIALQPPGSMPQQLIPAGMPMPRQMHYRLAHVPPPPTYGYPVMVPVPFCSAPIQHVTYGVDPIEAKRRRREQCPRHSESGSNSSTKSSRKSNNNNNVKRSYKPKSESRVTDITEEEVSKTYTGLDRAVAESFISTSMDRY